MYLSHKSRAVVLVERNNGQQELLKYRLAHPELEHKGMTQSPRPSRFAFGLTQRYHMAFARVRVVRVLWQS